MVLLYILIATFLISAIAFIGALALFLREEVLKKLNLFLVAFSAGGLLGGAFLHLIPEAFEELGPDLLLPSVFIIIGFCAFFILEQFINWHHCHKTEHTVAPFSYLILFSDAIHNIIDGLIIAASFIISVPTGVATVLAVALHEIPQEIGDFGVLIYGGLKKGRALLFNFLSGVTAILGGLAGFLLYEKIGGSIIFLLPFAAGGFIYIASADLIPEIKKKCGVREGSAHFSAFILGILMMLTLKIILE
ncbi:MAG: ZIP family metal transporter [bacterium]|nr:ZIP family metal transporter [bacterium]